MADNKEIKNNTGAPDPDEALKSFLDREQDTAKEPEKKSGVNKRILLIIIAIAVVALLVVLLIVFRSQPPAKKAGESTAPAEISVSVNSDGEHTAKVEVDENGSIKENGTGNLISYVPADISRIDVENSSGTFAVTSTTPEGEATVYKLVGLENYPLQEGIADEIASDASSIEFTHIVSADGDPAEFGLDKPRAVIKVSFTDNTTAVIRVGAEAPAQAGTYIAFGDSNAVYLVANDSVDSFMYSVNKFISLAITDAAEESDNATFKTLTITGTRYNEPITLVPNTDEAIETSYIVTEPRKMYANAIESFDIAGAVRGLYGEEVVSVNPSDKQLSSYGLSEPYAAVKAVYPDTEIALSASKPGDDGKVYIYNPDKNIVYTIQLAAVSWAKTSMEALIPEYILSAKLNAVSKVEFSAGGDSYTFDVTTSTELKDDKEGNTQEVTVTKAVYDSKELDSEYFRVFFQNLTGIKNSGDNGSGSGEVMSFTYTYSTGREPDTVTAYSTDSAQYAITLNGELVGSASKAYIDSLIENPAALIKGEPINNL